MQKRIRVDKGRVTLPDGIFVEGEGLEIEERTRVEGGHRGWFVFGFPLRELMPHIDILSRLTMTLYHANGDVMLHLINVSLYIQLSAKSDDCLVGEEEPVQAGV